MKKYSLHNRPLGEQLSLVSLFANALALGTAAFLIVLAELAINLLDNTREMGVTANIIADNARSALVFDDREFASKVLASCKAHPAIRQAILFRKDRSVLAAFQRTAKENIPLPPHAVPGGHEYRSDELLITRVISFQGDEVGALSIRSDLSEFYEKLRWFSLIAILVMILSIILVSPFRRRMQEIITAPLFTLVDSMHHVRDKGDYALRVETQREDELGQLISGFNDMLARIEERDQRLADYSEDLERKVALRTHTLTETNLELKREIKERRTVQRELARFKTTLDLTSDGVIMFHPVTQDIFYANQGAQNLTRFSGETLKKSRFVDLLPAIDELSLNRRLNALRQPNASFDTVESTLYPLDNDTIPVQIFLQYIEPNEEEGRYLAIIHDITEQKALERTLREARDAAEAASQAKGLFLANMSHEIRTPMNGVLGMTQLALNTELNDRQRNYLEKIHGSARTLLNILNDILDLSRIEADKMVVEKEEVDLQQLIEETTQLMAVSCYAKGLELLIDIAPATPPKITTDPQRLRQILTNLLNNAIKFTDQGHVALRVTPLSLERNGASRLCFSVEDTGIGVTREQIAQLFEPFAQADASHTRKFGGTGLGLALCKRLVELMGGEINGEPGPAGGSIFSFTLPYNHKRIHTESRAPRLQGRRILLLDRYPPSRTLLGGMLKQCGANVTISDCEPSSEQIGEADLVLCNIPGNGYEKPPVLSTREVREVPRLIMEPPPAGENPIDLEGENTILKPLTPQRLIETLVRFFDGSPLEAPHASRGLSKPCSNEAQTRRLRVLLAEDLAINREIAQEFLEIAGHSVIIAENGRQAVDILQREPVDLVLMDVQMPEMDGFEATRTLREDPRFADLPIIAMTAHAMRGDRDRCLRAGMNDYLTKPLIADVMLATIRKWCGEKKDSNEALVNPRNSQPAASPTPIPDLWEIPGLDAALALQRMMNNEDLLKRMLHRFYHHYQESTTELWRLIEAEEWNQALTQAHGIKGIAANLNMEALRAACETLEQALKERSAETREAFNDFKHRLEEVLQGIGRWRETQNEDSRKA